MKLHFTSTQLQALLQQCSIVLLTVALGAIILQHLFAIIWLLVGGVIGVALWWLDELVGLKYYRRDEHDTELITRSPLFILLFALIALFVVTSTDQHIGFGVVWGLSAGILVEGWRYATDPPAFLTRFFSMVSKTSQVTLDKVQIIQVTAGATVYVLVLLCLWILRLT